MKDNKVFKFTNSKNQTQTLEILNPKFSIEGLTTEEIETLQLLQDSQKHFAKILIRQKNPNGLENLLKINQKGTQTQKNFFSVNSSTKDGQNNELNQVPNSKLTKLQYEQNQGFYPQDMTQSEFDSLPNSIKQVKHSIITRDESGKLKARKNSQFFKQEITPVINNLKQIKTKLKNTNNLNLINYINSTIQILQDENRETIINQFKGWRNNDSNIDYVLETAQEIYDQRGIRGTAEADTFRNVSSKHQKIIDVMLKYVQEIDQNAPWKYKADNFTIPKLRYVDVLSFKGNHSTTPATTLGQNLPDEQFLKDEVGCITMIYANIIQAKISRQAPFFRSEFFPHIDQSLEKLISEAELYLVAGHEFTHATSKVTYTQNPHTLFKEKQYTIIEEARAETGALFYMNYLKEKGEIDETLEEIAYYTMLETMMDSLSKEKPLAHRGARNLMFHYMLDSGAITEHTNLREDSLPTYKFNIHKARTATKQLLGILGDIRSKGEVEQADQLIQKYIRTNRWEEFELRFKERGSQGIICNFPIITGDKNKGFKVEYKQNFTDHPSSPFQTL